MIRKTAVLLAVLVFTSWSGAASALVVHFSFDNAGGNTPGTVTGRIFGLTDNAANQSAASVLIDSIPAGLGGAFDVGNDVLTWNTQIHNTFSLSGGQVTFARFAAQHNPVPNFGTSDNFFLNSGLITSAGVLNNVLSIDNGQTFAGNNLGFAGTDYRVPEPATLTLFGLGLAGLGVFRRKKV